VTPPSAWPTLGSRSLGGYAFALATTTLAGLLSVWLEPYIARVIFILFWPAVLLTAWYGGRGPALLATGLAVLIVDFFLIPPVGFVLPHTPADWMSVASFALLAGTMGALTAAFRSTRDRATAAEFAVQERLRDSEEQAAELEQQREEAQALAEELEQTNEELMRANEELATAGRRAQRVLDLATGLGDAATLDQMADLVHQAAMTALDADAGSLAVLADDADGTPAFVMLCRTGFPPELDERFRTFPLTPGRPLSDAVLTKQPVLIESAAEWRARYPVMAAQTPELAFEAMANVPVMTHGQPIAGLTLSFRAPRRFDEATRTFLVTIGEQLGLALARAQAFEAERRAAERSAFLSEASALLAASLDYEVTLRAVAHAAVPRLGDWCAVDMIVDPTTHAWPPRIERLAVVHQDPAKIEWAREFERRLPTDWNASTGIPRVLKEGVTEFYPSLPDELLVAAAKTSEELALLREIGMSSLIIVPLIARGRTLGAVTLLMTESGRRYTEADRTLAEDLARRAAVAVDNARLYREAARAREEAERTRTDAERARAEAESANHAKSDFLTMMSHELRTPLNAIAGYVQLLEMGIHGAVSAAQREVLGRVQRSEAALRSLIEDILSFARIESGRLEYQFTDMPLDETLAQIEELITPQIQAKGLRYEYRRIDPTVSVWADRQKLEQVVINLLSNAVKFTEQGEIVVNCEVRPDDVLVRVHDTGAGIPAERFESIFEPFVQLQPPLTRTTHGSGLGLAISRDLARAMGGDVVVDSSVGVGSTFTLRLPRHAPAGAIEHDAPRNAHQTTPEDR
jgi:signal transduction histidine kinase